MNRLFRRLNRLILPLLLLLAVRTTAVAQQSPFSSMITVTYGQKVAFQLSGQVEATVERIDLFVQPARAERPFTVEVVRLSQSDGQLIADVDIDPKLAEIPPFAEVRFWWELQTAASQTIVVPEDSFTYRDDRFNWRSFAQDDVATYWTGNDEDLGQLAWKIAIDSRQHLNNILPPTAVPPLNLYIYPATADLRAGLRLAGRDWQAGHTDPDLGVLLVTAVNSLTAAADLGQSIPHEMAHLRLYQLAPEIEWPAWYEEGLARLKMQDNSEVFDLVATAVAEDAVQTLLELCTQFPLEAPRSDLALAQSVSLLRYIQDQFGDQGLRQLGSAYAAGASCEAGLTDALSVTLVELNTDWLRAQQPQPAWRIFLGQNGLWLLLILGSFAIFLFAAKR